MARHFTLFNMPEGLNLSIIAAAVSGGGSQTFNQTDDSIDKSAVRLGKQEDLEFLSFNRILRRTIKQINS